MSKKSKTAAKGILLGLTIIMALIIPLRADAWSNGWSDPIAISGTDGSSYGPHLAIDSQGTIHMVWFDWIDLNVHPPYVLYANKPAAGNWSTYQTMPGSPQGDMPALAIGPDDTLHIVWVGNDDAVKYVSRTVNGVWGTVQTLPSSNDSNYPDVAVAPNGKVHVVWNYDNVFDKPHQGIFHAVKSGGGWTTPVCVYQDQYATQSLLETDADSTAHLVINRYETTSNVYYASKPNTEAWTTASELSFTPNLQSVEQMVSDSTGTLYLVWGENDYLTTCRLYLSQLPQDGGWSIPGKIVDGDCGNIYIYYPSVTIDHQGEPLIAWTGRLGLDWHAWFAFKSSGAGWSSPLLINDHLAGSDNTVSIVVGSDGVHHIVWDSGPVYVPPEPDNRGEIFYSRLDEPPEPPVTAIITSSGGSLQSASGDVQLNFPPGAVSEDVAVTYTKAFPTPTGTLAGNIFFDLSAAKISDGTPVTSFAVPYSLTVDYSIQGAGPALENTLSLYYWDGMQWQQEPTSVLEVGSHTVSASLNHMTLFALLGDTLHRYLPFAIR